MAVNVSKTKFIIFKPKGMNAKIDESNWFYLDNNDIDSQNDPAKMFKLDRISSDNPVICDRTYKLLGVYLDEHLSFDYHCTAVCNEIARSNYIISRVKNLLPTSSLKT
jgi:hypothetical protein